MSKKRAKKQTVLPTVSIIPNPRRFIEGEWPPVHAYMHPEGDGQIYLCVNCQGADLTIEFEDIEQAATLVKELSEVIAEERENRK